MITYRIGYLQKFICFRIIFIIFFSSGDKYYYILGYFNYYHNRNFHKPIPFTQPEGETIYKNKAFFVDLRKETLFERNITLDIPANIVPDSEYIEIGAVGKYYNQGCEFYALKIVEICIIFEKFY